MGVASGPGAGHGAARACALGVMVRRLTCVRARVQAAMVVSQPAAVATPSAAAGSEDDQQAAALAENEQAMLETEACRLAQQRQEAASSVGLSSGRASGAVRVRMADRPAPVVGSVRLSLDKARNRASFLHKQHKEGTFCGGRGGSRQPNKRLAHKNANRVRSTGQTQKNRTKRKERSLDADSPLRLSIARKVADAQPQVEVHRPSGAAWQSPGDAREGTAIPAPKGALWCRAHG